MLRSSTSTSMQKVYDDCFLICSTAVYFEQQNNEAEALRSWKEALDQIYYYNAYKIPAGFRPKTETEKALLESLRDMELKCKERVDLLEALRISRLEAGTKASNSSESLPISRTSSMVGPIQDLLGQQSLGEGTVPPLDFAALKPTVSSQKQPRHSSEPNIDVTHSKSSIPSSNPASLLLPPTSERRASRSPSPEKKSSSMFRTTLRPNGKSHGKLGPNSMRPKPRPAPPPASVAASLAWPGLSGDSSSRPSVIATTSAIVPRPQRRASSELAQTVSNSSTDKLGSIAAGRPGIRSRSPNRSYNYDRALPPGSSPQRRSFDIADRRKQQSSAPVNDTTEERIPPPVPPHRTKPAYGSAATGPGKRDDQLPKRQLPAEFPTYRKEYPVQSPIDPKKASSISVNGIGGKSPKNLDADTLPSVSPLTGRRPVVPRKAIPPRPGYDNNESQENLTDYESELINSKRQRRPGSAEQVDDAIELPAEDLESSESQEAAWNTRVAHLMKNLPGGVDEQAAKSIFHEIVVHGDEVHWDDVAGLDAAKTALREAVVYPFLRPDLFSGLREPARGILLFGPPGTGKTMLARAVATESKSTFFSISASSLTSKFLGESEKLVRALFALAKALAPSIIFVDEIDSLLSSRGGSSEHEATRRIKTEFLIQWSSLQKAAAGRDAANSPEGDVTRVLVLAATNTPWEIDEAARRRFVRRQYIPLPEPHVRESQLRTLLKQQRHDLKPEDFNRIVKLSEGFSGSDMTNLAKDAAMQPLRSLGERLLDMSPEEIRPIQFQDFQRSLITIRPSVSKEGLRKFDEWAREFGERGG